MCCAYIVQNLLVATSTASVRALIGQAVCYAGVHALAESVGQNCVLGRFGNFSSIVVQQVVACSKFRHAYIYQYLLEAFKG